MKKLITALLAGTMIMGSLSGCSSQNTGNGTEAVQENAGQNSNPDSGTGSGEVKTLEVVWFSDGKEGETFLKLAEQYQQENPNIKIELIEVPYSDHENKIKNMINGKQAPALARLTNVGPFKNQLLDLAQYVSEGEAFADNFNEGIKFVYEGKIIAAPMDVTANGLIYNKTAFEQAGVSVPQSPDEAWTWEEWKTAMQTVVENSDCRYGLVFDKSSHRFATLMYQAGGSMLTEDLSASNFNTPANGKAVSFFKELHDQQIIPDSVWLGSENPNNLFRTGQVAMHFAGSWMVANYKNEITDFEWGVTYLPKDVQRSSIPGGKYLAAFQGSGVEQEAADFIEWISRAENNAVYCQENSYLSQVKGNEELEYEYGSEFFAIFTNELASSGSQPGAEWGYQELTGAVQLDIREQLVDVLAGKTSVEDYLQNIDGLINEALEEIQ